MFNPSPDHKIKQFSKLKPFAGDNLRSLKTFHLCISLGKKHCGKWRKCWLPAFSPFPTLFFNRFIPNHVVQLSLWGKGLMNTIWQSTEKTSHNWNFLALQHFQNQSITLCKNMDNTLVRKDSINLHNAFTLSRTSPSF